MIPLETAAPRSEGLAPKARAQFLTGRILIVLVLLLVGLFCYHSINSINQDIGRHLKSGQIIWQSGSVYKTNLFSYTEPDQPFVNHHWLSEVVMYLLDTRVGLVGLVVAAAMAMAAAFWLTYAAVRGRASPLAWALSALTGLAVISGRTDIRPEMFSYLFLAYFLFAIFRSKYFQEHHWLYALPFVELAWANMHIYFPLGLGLIGLYMLERWAKRGPIRKQTLWLTIATAGAMLVNPNFLTGALEPFTILQHYGYSIVENQSIFFLKNYGILLTQINIFLLAAIIFVLSYIPAIKKFGFKNYIFEIVAGGVFLFLGADMIRNFGPFAILMMPILALNLQALFERRNWPVNSLKFNIGGAILAVLLIWATVTGNAYAWLGTDNTFGPSIPASAQDGVDFVLNNHISGPVFNNFDVGSYLIWKLYPEQKVFVDGRPEAYSVDFFQNIYEPMQEDQKTFDHYADDVYHVNYIFFDYHDITPWAQTFLSWIQNDPNWPLVYRDNSVAIFLRRAPQNLPVISKYAK